LFLFNVNIKSIIIHHLNAFYGIYEPTLLFSAGLQLLFFILNILCIRQITDTTLYSFFMNSA